MEERNELSDIVLERQDGKSQKARRMLVIAALLIVVFLVALLAMKMVNKPVEKDNSKLILPPEPVTKEVAVAKEEQLFKQVPIVEENPKKDSFEDMIKTLKEKEMQKQESEKSPTEDIKKEVVEPKKVVETKATAEEPVTQPAKKVVEEPKKETPKPKTSTAIKSGSIYVQVGATSKSTPDVKFLDSLKKNGFDVKLQPVEINNQKLTKILVGPYSTEAEANTALAKARASINKNAFIYRIK
ncbi:MAG: SPOR domain-containing protein [Sulfurospirillaceae bacterium]|nr:SPOR domain-containing protein [Sulfurospirillaceae bacterium]MDD3462397.1 SPOR domain-containing protein [Sulfurospirillaceae bacterium]